MVTNELNGLIELNNQSNKDKVQAAKDFIWAHLEQPQRDLFTHQATSESLKENNLSIKRLIIGYEFD